MLSRGIPWNMPLVLKARVYTENTSDAWHIPLYPTRKQCITSRYVYSSLELSIPKLNSGERTGDDPTLHIVPLLDTSTGLNSSSYC